MDTRSEWQCLKRVEVVQGSRASTKIDAVLDACLYILAGKAYCFGDAVTHGKLACDSSCKISAPVATFVRGLHTS